MALNSRDFAFVREYCIDHNGQNAAIRAGVPEPGAATTAYRLLCRAEVVAAIAEREKDLAAAAGLSVEWVLRQWKEVAEADPNDLMWNELESCRHCHGQNHEFQWTEFEYRKAVQGANEHLCGPKCEQPCSKKIPPLPTGGFGFDPHLPPALDCPVCHGDGVVQVRIADTRRLKGAARWLYAGIKQTQHGIEVKTRNQDLARDNIAKYLGMLIDKKELAGPGGGPIPHVHVDAKDLTDDQLAQIIHQERASVVESS